MFSKEKAVLAAKILDDKKGENIKVLEVKGLTSLGDYFVLATGSSSTHVNALSDTVEEKLKESGVTLKHREGKDGWILLDYGDIIVDIFDYESADFYDLERLWSDAPQREFN